MPSGPVNIGLDAILDGVRSALRSGLADVAEILIGPPNKALSNRTEWRWGNKGSFRVCVAGPNKGACADFESGWKGDPLALVMHARDCGFTDAVLWGATWAGIDSNGRRAAPDDLSARQAGTADRERKRTANEAHRLVDQADRAASARRIWEASIPASGTLAEEYLVSSRHIPRIEGPWPACVGFYAGNGRVTLGERGPDGGEIRRDYPTAGALILAATDPGGIVCGVQRIYLTDAAQNVRVAAGGKIKRSFGVFRDAGAVVRLPGPADGPLLLAEGPETGLSVWASTGCETWIALGGIANHNPPHGRRVVVVRDDDRAQAPADKALARGLDKWRKSGVDAVVATPWPVRRCDKSDFNDTIREGGVAAVRERIQAALSPPALLIRRVSIGEGRRNLAGAIDRFVVSADTHNAAMATAKKQATSDLTASAAFPAEVVASRKAKAALKAATLTLRRVARFPRGERRVAVEMAQEAVAAARLVAKGASTEAKNFKSETQKLQRKIQVEARNIARASVGAPPVHAVRADVGSGKSAATRRAMAGMLRRMRANGDKRAAAFVVPTHVLGAEQARLFEAEPDAVAIGLHAAIWRGREAADPDRPGKTMCQDLDAVADAREALADPQTSVCRKAGVDGVRECRFFGECAYQAQRRAKPDLWFAAHEMLFLPKPSSFGDLIVVIVDESAWQDGLIGADGNHSQLSLDTLDQYDEVPGQSIASHRLHSLRKALHDALASLPDGPVPRSAILAANIGPDAASEARKIEWMRKVDAEIYPNMPTSERKAAVKAAGINRTVQRLSLVWKAVEALACDDGPEASGWISLATADTKDGMVRVIRLKGCKPVTPGWDVPTLLIDAILQPDLVRPFWPLAQVTADIRIESPHQHVIQVGDRSYSKRHLSNVRKRREVHAIICREARALAPGRVLVVAQKEIEGLLPDVGPLPVNVELAHHNAVAGRDEWGPGSDRPGVVGLIVVGRTAPSPVAVERQAEALTGAAITPLPGWYEKAEAVREMADGTMRASSADRHPHPVAEAIRWQIAEGELVQIIGRPRGVNRTATDPVAVLVMTDAPLPLPLMVMIGASDAVPTPADLMMGAGGVALENHTDAASAYPTLWLNGETARKAMARRRLAEGRGKNREGLGQYLISNVLSEIVPNLCTTPPNLCAVARYQVAGTGCSPSVAC